MADKRISELASASWGGSLFFAVVDAGTTKQISSDDFLLTTSAQASAIAQAAIATYGAVTTAQASAIADDAAIAVRVFSTTAQAVSAAGGGGSSTTSVTLSTSATGTSVSAAVSKDEVLIVLDNVGINGTADIVVDLTTNGGTSYIVTGYKSWSMDVAGMGSQGIGVSANSWSLFGAELPIANQNSHMQIRIVGLRSTGTNIRKMLSFSGTIDGSEFVGGGGTLANTGNINGVRLRVTLGASFDDGTITVMQR